MDRKVFLDVSFLDDGYIQVVIRNTDQEPIVLDPFPADSLQTRIPEILAVYIAPECPPDKLPVYGGVKVLSVPATEVDPD